MNDATALREAIKQGKLKTPVQRGFSMDASKAVNAFAQVGSVGEHLIAVENTPQVHNMVVCTLCSCYPTDVLGLPPGETDGVKSLLLTFESNADNVGE